MGVPKRRQGNSRTNMRRSAWSKMEAPTLAECPQCHELKQPHKACPTCGYYKGKAVIAIKENK